MKTLKFTFLPPTFLAVAAMLGGCVGVEPDETSDEWMSELGEQADEGLEMLRPPVNPEVDGLAVVEGDIRIDSIDDPAFFVQQTYQDVLNRSPDWNGFFHYYNVLQNCNGDSACLGSGRAYIALDLLQSSENRQQDPDLNPFSPGYNAAFVTHCYTNFLRRQPSTAELVSYLNRLSSSGYKAIVNEFITSSEYRGRFGM